jgi:hypothetical protein
MVNDVDGGFNDRLKAEKKYFGSRPQREVVDVTLNALDVSLGRC